MIENLALSHYHEFSRTLRRILNLNKSLYYLWNEVTVSRRRKKKRWRKSVSIVVNVVMVIATYCCLCSCYHTYAYLCAWELLPINREIRCIIIQEPDKIGIKVKGVFSNKTWYQFHIRCLFLHYIANTCMTCYTFIAWWRFVSCLRHLTIHAIKKKLISLCSYI